jgi:hypothetical protein
MASIAFHMIHVTYHINDQDAIRRAYIVKGPLKPFAHDFPKIKISDRGTLNFMPIFQLSVWILH